jgi:hypothetical protein
VIIDNPIPLLPCPWCGSENVEHETFDNDECGVQCKDCGASGPTTEWHENGLLESIVAWNKGPYADRLEIHAKSLRAHADALRAKADEHRAKADELEKKATEALL